MEKFILRITGNLGFEAWQDIPGYEGLYQASTYGRIKSLPRKGTIGRILKAGKDDNGYLYVVLGKDGKNICKRVHRLIALTFIPNPEGLPVINHKTENATDNRVECLEYCTQKYNCNYGSHKEKLSKAQINDIEKSKVVLQFDIEGNLINTYPSLSEVIRTTGFCGSNISLCCKNKRKTAYGYRWRYE